MKDLNKILEYQKTDIELRKILDILEKSDDGKKMETAKAAFNSAKSIVLQCEAQAQSLIESQDNLVAQRDELLKDTERLILIVENNEDENEIDGNIVQLEEMKNKLAEFEKKANEIKARIEKVINEYKEANENGRKQRQVFMTAKEKQDNLKAKYIDKINELNGKLEAMAKGIDSETLEKYKAIVAEGKYPAFVEAYHDESADMFSCRGCGLALSQKNKSELLENGACRCETCRRIIYRQ